MKLYVVKDDNIYLKRIADLIIIWREINYDDNLPSQNWEHLYLAEKKEPYHFGKGVPQTNTMKLRVISLLEVLWYDICLSSEV